MQPAVNIWQSGIVQIIDPKLAKGIFDPFLNQDSDGAPGVLWQGTARIQPMRAPLNVQTENRHTDLIGVRVQIPLSVDIGAIHKGLQVVVVDGGEDPELERFQYVVQGSMGSSMAWVRTLDTEVDIGVLRATEDINIGYGVKPYGIEGYGNS
nr:unknown [Clavibacter phage CN77]